eukprot:CAMPEP_0172382368 /NCGR_PEP_ID=MMETSP1061-20121228/312_1 /TAXON_ID=37318 /ORGANISM="Pseudo-nitzschia pungens, Strain cf. pungens" /LENGTH=355 /DNA_ID=CAMNT_0013110213 /DNA_START=138 /DNA_END=1201 /DNA_ORIENTATION=-
MVQNKATVTGRRRPRSSTPEIERCLRLPSLMLLVFSLSRIDLSASFGLVSPSRRGSGVDRASLLKVSTARSTLSLRNGALEQRLRSSTVTSSGSGNGNSPTALNVWWFGGDQSESKSDDESCELVAVRIERPTSNSRKIAGELSVPGVSVEDVWSILTDYNRLSIHVPNLRESRIVRENKSNNNNNNFLGGGEKSHPGDGSYQCQLYQVGAQKIVGFDFSASVTMDMTEQILTASTSNARKINFKCVDSQFFSTFDGAWTIQEQLNAATGEEEVLCSYDVLVKPKGPVPVAALEWRIREDVPTNLRAVKAATLGMVGGSSSSSSPSSTSSPSSSSMQRASVGSGRNGPSRRQNPA